MRERLIGHDAVAAAALGDDQRLIGHIDELFGHGRVGQPLRDSKAGRHSHALAAHREAQLGEPAPHALGPPQGLRLCCFGQDDAELFAAVAPGDVAGANALGEHAAELANHLVARLVAVQIVDPLEEVDVEHHARQRRVIALRPPPFATQVVEQGAAVRQSGDRVGVGDRAQAVLELGEPRTGPQPGRQLVAIDGLLEKVVGACFQAAEHVGRVATGGEKDGVDVVAEIQAADPPHEIRAVQLRNVPIRHQDRRPLRLDQLPSLAAILRPVNLIAVRFQPFGQ